MVKTAMNQLKTIQNAALKVCLLYDLEYNVDDLANALVCYNETYVDVEDNSFVKEEIKDQIIRYLEELADWDFTSADFKYEQITDEQLSYLFGVKIYRPNWIYRTFVNCSMKKLNDLNPKIGKPFPYFNLDENQDVYYNRDINKWYMNGDELDAMKHNIDAKQLLGKLMLYYGKSEFDVATHQNSEWEYLCEFERNVKRIYADFMNSPDKYIVIIKGESNIGLFHRDEFENFFSNSDSSDVWYLHKGLNIDVSALNAIVVMEWDFIEKNSDFTSENIFWE